ncbi:hypothetical protein GCM10007424_10520 [Flavobacterium suaedae]|uniref:YcxB family protein n=1 Tax=Flavobacterium suaedae TaxID=1767027 RepID=A0ABQ1JQU7_9FLAO|nr:hypothetical protein [Flavobacterium suaedae]GGB72458.1 hypothetical protein GCM10007424_10520 [Flavobacterium suaedae]
MKDRVWSCLVNCKYKSFLIQLLYKKYQKREWRISLFLTIASSSSIAGWLIWDKLELIWTIIIAVSQAITTIRPLLPYNKYIKELGTKSMKLENLNLEYERFWDSISKDKFSDDEVEDFYYDLKRQGIEILRFSDEVFFDVPKKVSKEAEERMSVFLRSNYNVKPINE